MSSRRGAARGRAVLLPELAKNEGSRLLRGILLRHSIGSIAKRLTCDEKSVRMWAAERTKPSWIMRVRIRERLSKPPLRIEISESSWDEPTSDAYSTSEPMTSRLKG